MVIQKCSMEGLVMNTNFWTGKKVLLTGHTGFKGGWLSVWLKLLGAEVTGIAMNPPTQKNIFDVANISKSIHSIIGDIRDINNVVKAIELCRPEIVFHMAAQSLVKYSYQNPIETYSTNVMGTLNVMEAVRQAGCAKVFINVTTDKCYENKEWAWGYREDEPMGGFDPYSSSKACSEILTSSYRRSFFEKSCIGLASARAGNVIGGGDWAEDRLVPDILRALDNGLDIVLRNPDSSRPWQHVLDPLSGYLTLAEHVWNNPITFAEAWNFGPNDNNTSSVGYLTSKLLSKFQPSVGCLLNRNNELHEAHQLKLDISKAQAKLNWNPTWALDDAIEATADWHKAYKSGLNMYEKTVEQIAAFTADNKRLKLRME